MKAKNIKYEFRGLNRDINPEKHPPNMLYDANNIRYLSTSTAISGSMAFEKGNLLRTSIPSITIDRSTDVITYNSIDLKYTAGNEIDTDTSIPTSSNTQEVIGYTVTRDSVILFSTDDAGMDCIWELDNTTWTLTLKYLRNLGFSKQRPIQAIFNYENENIQKVYWVDGDKQIRFLNLEYESIEGNGLLIDVPSDSINFVGAIEFSQPTITSIGGGGTHTAGMIQYAYNLYRLNNSQTKPSPLSELVPLGNELGGGELNEVVGAAPIVQIDDIDQSYTHIKVYAIKYTSLNQTPSINLIEEREIGGATSITIFDDGSTISSLSLEEFLFLGSDPYVPQHIESKDNSLFLFNVKEKSFVLPDELDTRAYSFPASSTSTTVFDNVTSTAGGSPTGSGLTVDNTYMVPLEHDAVNLDYNTNKYQYNSTTLGGEGIYIKYEINTNPTLVNNEDTYQFFKDREIYRIGIQFYNRLGQVSLPKWIADFRSPSSNLQGNYGTLKVELQPAFVTWLASYAWESEDDIPVGYKIIRANRTINDRTIICQGFLSGMMVNSVRDNEGDPLYTLSEKRADSEQQPKLPNFLVRTFEDISPLKANAHLTAMQEDVTSSTTYPLSSTTNPLTEIQYDTSERKADTYQYTVMMQMYSPEIQFGTVSLNSSTKLGVVGGLRNTQNDYWGKERAIINQTVNVEGKALNGLTPHASGVTIVDINGSATDLMDRGLISETNGTDPDRNVEFNQWNREFTTYVAAPNEREYHIYGSPEKTIRGQGRTTYNNNTKYEYSNTLEGFLSDGEDEFNDDGNTDRAVISLNSYGADCITLVCDNGSQTDVPPHTRTSLENLYANSNIGNTDVVLVGEMKRPDTDSYLAAIYGGNTFEDKKRTNYLEIGEYQDITTTSVQIDSPGDTFVQTYKIMRIGKTDTEIFSSGVNQLTELVTVKLETTVDLSNRNDTSFSAWDSNFQPRYDEYHLYNTVYSQQPTLVQNTDVDFNFRRVKNFDTRIQATKVKIPNETIDSWTDVLTNEVLDLDGKYGPINGVISWRDNIYTFQDNAFAMIGINPRVQTQGSDGLSIELGTGSKLYDYNYISTKTGSINKWGMVASERGIYWIDGLNKRMQRFTGQLELLSELKGFHSYFENTLSVSTLRIDNPLLGTGVSMGYDQKNNDIYLTYNNSITLAFNELLDEYTSFYSYNSPFYIWNKETFLTTKAGSNNTLWEHHAGTYNNFYGANRPSSVIMIANPEPDHECIFSNLEWKSIAQPSTVVSLSIDDRRTGDDSYTWESVRMWHEFQDSGEQVPSLRRLNRKWRLALPRDNQTKTGRIRNTWTYIELSSNNTDGYFYVNQAIVLHYIPNYVVIR